MRTKTIKMHTLDWCNEHGRILREALEGTNRMRSLCVVIVISFDIDAVWLGLYQ